MSEAAALPEEEAAQILDTLETGVVVPAAERFALGARREKPSERLVAMERLGEKVARALRGAIEPLAAARTRVIAQPVTTGDYEGFTDTLAPFTSLSHYRIDALNGGMLVAIEPQFVAALLERYYGGGIGQAEPFTRKEFTAGEELLLGRLLDRLVGTLSEQWQALAPIDPRLVQRETAIADIGFLRGEDEVAIQRFTLSPDGCASTTVAIAYPLAMLRPIEERQSTQIEDKASAAADLWRARLSDAVAEVRLPVRSVLARPEITLSALMALKVGDVIPIQLSDRTPLLVASRQIAAGTIGEQEGRAAMLIEHVGRN